MRYDIVRCEKVNDKLCSYKVGTVWSKGDKLYCKLNFSSELFHLFPQKKWDGKKDYNINNQQPEPQQEQQDMIL